MYSKDVYDTVTVSTVTSIPTIQDHAFRREGLVAVCRLPPGRPNASAYDFLFRHVSIRRKERTEGTFLRLQTCSSQSKKHF